ncbi:hypothetical protein P8452_41931 [Trifolium repens]|nr:hypothetical protein P8452_41931 [Trifolium repens]
MAENVMKLSDTQWNTEQVEKIPPNGVVVASGSYPYNPYAMPNPNGVAEASHIMPPYGTPPHPYVAMYPHGGIYAHPSMPPGSYPYNPYAMPTPNTPASMENDGKPPEVKEKLPIKRSKGSLGSLNMITGKNNEHGKTTGTSANGIHSKSGSGSFEGTSEGSDANSLNDSQLKSGDRRDSYEGEPSQNGSSAHTSQNGGLNASHTVVNHSMSVIPISASGAPGAVAGPATNLNIGMDYLGTPTSSNVPSIRGKVPSTTVAGGVVTGGSLDSVQSQLWLQHIMPPYGTPPHPHVAMYPHGGINAHPSMPLGSYAYNPYAMPTPNGVAEASAIGIVNNHKGRRQGLGLGKNPIHKVKLRITIRTSGLSAEDSTIVQRLVILLGKYISK